MPYRPECTEVTTACPVEATIYGYRPDLGANTFYLVIFGLCGVAQVLYGIKYKTWTFMIAVGAGSFIECAGYVGRVIMNDNPWDKTGTALQLIALIIAPAFVAAGVYLSLKHLCLLFGEKYSMLRAKWYTWIFISADVVSILIQAIGGATDAYATSGSGGSGAAQTGTWITLAGIVFQVFSLLVFGILFGSYFWRVYRDRKSLPEDVKARTKAGGLYSLRSYLFAIVVAYFTVFVRCVYRIPELSDGFASATFRNETTFMVFDGAMILVACVTLSVVHPGIAFPVLSKDKAKHAHVELTGRYLDGDM